MSKKVRIYTKPYITGAAFLLVGLAGLLWGLRISEKYMDGYALVLFSGLFMLTGAIIFVLYAKLERKYRKALEAPLLYYTLGAGEYDRSAWLSAMEIKSSNRLMLFVMLFFCGLLAVFGLFLPEDGYIVTLIALGLGVFLALAQWIITAFRVKKLRRGNHLVVLAKGGAYTGGEFHSWQMPGTSLVSAEYKKEPAGSPLAGVIEIRYRVVTPPTARTVTCTVPVPAGREAEARAAVETVHK